MSSHWLLTSQFNGDIESHILFDDVNIAKSTFKNMIKIINLDYSEFEEEFDENI